MSHITINWAKCAYLTKWPDTSLSIDLLFSHSSSKLEDLKVLRRSPDLLDYVKNRSRSTTTYFVLPYMEVAAILVK